MLHGGATILISPIGATPPSVFRELNRCDLIDWRMRRPRGEAILNRINATLQERKGAIADRRKRLRKADRRATAQALEREIEAFDVEIDALKVHQKLLKRGIGREDGGQES